MKCKVRALMLMLLMCWASQGSAQATEANPITPAVVKQLNEENKEGCEDVTLNYDKKSRELSHKNDLRHTGEPIKPEELVIQRLGELGIETKGQASSRLLQQPKLGILKTEKVKGDYYVSLLKNKDAPKGYIPVETKAYRYYLNEGLSPSIPMDKQGKIETNDWHMEDVVKFEITVNSKKFVVKYNIHISHDDSGSCWDGSKDDQEAG